MLKKYTALMCALSLVVSSRVIFGENQESVVTLQPSTEAVAHESSKIIASWQHYSAFDAQIYNDLKEAVFAKDPSIIDWFNATYPKPTKEAVLYLAQYIDAIGPWAERYPPFATAIVGTREVYLDGWVGLIIYSPTLLAE